jgi:hypothetical protein
MFQLFVICNKTEEFQMYVIKESLLVSPSYGEQLCDCVEFFWCILELVDHTKEWPFVYFVEENL